MPPELDHYSRHVYNLKKMYANCKIQASSPCIYQFIYLRRQLLMGILRFRIIWMFTVRVYIFSSIVLILLSYILFWFIKKFTVRVYILSAPSHSPIYRISGFGLLKCLPSASLFFLFSFSFSYRIFGFGLLKGLPCASISFLLLLILLYIVDIWFCFLI